MQAMIEFKEAVADVAARAGLDRALALEAVSVPRERERADLSLPCFRLGKPPHEVAKRIAAAFVPGGLLASAEAAGPFVNFRFERAAATRLILDAVGPAFGRTDLGRGKCVVIDYGSPNIAKPLLFHHLRSAVIGQALCRLHRFCGYEVVGLNYLGDVGTAFGKLMVGFQRFGEAHTAEALNETYVRASTLCAEDEGAMAEAREWARKLEEEDPTAKRLWEGARRISLEGFLEVYDWLGIRHDVVDGEQMYVKPAAALIERLLSDGRARESDGAVVLDPADPKLGVLLLRKSDGATLYQTRDLAAAIDRHRRYGFARMLYVVDIAQELHFQQLFSGLEALGHPWARQCRHVAFGQVLMGGKRAKTREGRGVLLTEVLREGERRAAEIIREKNAALANPAEVAKAVGVAAVVFTDLGLLVRKDIHFDWDEILSFDGRTGPYLQYVHASASSILRKGGGAVPPEPSRGGAGAPGGPGLLLHDLEWELVRRLAEWPEVVVKACEECEPSLVSAHLYELAREFRSYHTAGGRDATLRVLVDDAALRAARLRLVAAVQSNLAIGLELLGIAALVEM